MKFLSRSKDGGPESRVTGLFLVEIKRLFSLVLLRFADGSREAYHSHAFDAVSWVLRGRLDEHMLGGSVNVYTPSWCPIITRRTTFHKVYSTGDTWVFSLRGPWARTWQEYLPVEDRVVTLTHGRREVEAELGGYVLGG